MDNYTLLELFENMEISISFEQLFSLPTGYLCYSSENSSPFQNHLLTNRVLSPEELQSVELKFKSLGRKSAIFFEKRDDLRALEELVLAQGYKKEWEDSWMFYEKPSVDSAGFDTVHEVKNEDDLRIFLSVFDLSFEANDPLNPYGDVKNFLPETEKAWKKFSAAKRVQYFIAYQGNEPVAVAALNNFKQAGYISCVGTLRSVRGKGYGKVITLFAVAQSIRNGNKLHFLATEEGTNPNAFYKHIGFVHRFSAPGYTKEI